MSDPEIGIPLKSSLLTHPRQFCGHAPQIMMNLRRLGLDGLGQRCHDLDDSSDSLVRRTTEHDGIAKPPSRMTARLRAL